MSDTLDAAPSSAVVAESEVTSSTTSAQDDATADTTTTTTTPAPVKTEVEVQVEEKLVGIDLGEAFMNKIFIILGGKKQWRPVFDGMFRQGIKRRRRAVFLRHLLVESRIEYSDICNAYKVS